MKTKTLKTRKAGLPPGSLVHVGDLKSDTSRVTICIFGEGMFQVYHPKQIDDMREALGIQAPVIWVNVDGLADIDIIAEIGDHFNLHKLTLEDILNADQRARQEDYEDYTYIACKALAYNDKSEVYETEQVSILLGKDFVISFSERETDNFALLRRRLETDKNQLRKRGADYLAYAMLDLIVDDYFTVLEHSGNKLENLEEKLLQDPDQKTLQAVHSLKREMLGMRQAVWPLREVLVGLEKSDAYFLHKDTAFHLRDVYHHTVQIIDTIEIYREMLSGLLEIYLSSVNNRLNEIMKILTMFTAIFIPLTLISGIYGMNFTYMPELNWLYGYPFALSLMVSVVLVMIVYFKRKKWL